LGYKSENWHVYKLIGFKRRPISATVANYTPIYGLVEKKGYKAGGHTIVEYGKFTQFDFNREKVWNYHDALENPMALLDMASKT